MPASERLQMGAVQPERGLLARTTISRRRCLTSSRRCRRCSSRRPPSTTCFRWTINSSSARSRRGQALTAGRTVFTYSGEISGIRPRQCTEHPEQVLHDHRGGRCPGGRRRRDDRHRGRPLRRVWAVPAQGQAGVRLQRSRCSRSSTGKARQPLAAGKHTIVFDFTYDGPGIAKGGTGVLKVDGQDVATQKMPRTIPFLMPADETFDVGVDTRTSVNEQDYQVPFRVQRHDRQADLQARARAVDGSGARADSSRTDSGRLIGVSDALGNRLKVEP